MASVLALFIISSGIMTLLVKDVDGTIKARKQSETEIDDNEKGQTQPVTGIDRNGNSRTQSVAGIDGNGKDRTQPEAEIAGNGKGRKQTGRAVDNKKKGWKKTLRENNGKERVRKPKRPNNPCKYNSQLDKCRDITDVPRGWRKKKNLMEMCHRLQGRCAGNNGVCTLKVRGNGKKRCKCVKRKPIY